MSMSISMPWTLILCAAAAEAAAVHVMVPHRTLIAKVNGRPRKREAFKLGTCGGTVVVPVVVLPKKSRLIPNLATSPTTQAMSERSPELSGKGVSGPRQPLTGSRTVAK